MAEIVQSKDCDRLLATACEGVWRAGMQEQNTPAGGQTSTHLWVVVSSGTRRCTVHTMEVSLGRCARCVEKLPLSSERLSGRAKQCLCQPELKKGFSIGHDRWHPWLAVL